MESMDVQVCVVDASFSAVVMESEKLYDKICE